MLWVTRLRVGVLRALEILVPSHICCVVIVIVNRLGKKRVFIRIDIITAPVKGQYAEYMQYIQIFKYLSI